MADSVLGKTREIETPAGPIRYRERGEGPPIVFLHGIIANGWLWRRVVPALADEYRCITPDWPLGSHELGLHADADMSLPALARMVEQFFEELELDGVTLVANDTGGAIAQWVAVHDPARLGRLVLTPCDAFENFLPPALRHLQLFGSLPRACASGRSTGCRSPSAGSRCGRSIPRRWTATPHRSAPILRCVPTSRDSCGRSAPTTPRRRLASSEALRSLRLLCGRWTTACSRCATAIGSPIGCRRVRL